MKKHQTILGTPCSRNFYLQGYSLFMENGQYKKEQYKIDVDYLKKHLIVGEYYQYYHTIQKTKTTLGMFLSFNKDQKFLSYWRHSKTTDFIRKNGEYYFFGPKSDHEAVMFVDLISLDFLLKDEIVIRDFCLLNVLYRDKSKTDSPKHIYFNKLPVVRNDMKRYRDTISFLKRIT